MLQAANRVQFAVRVTYTVNKTFPQIIFFEKECNSMKSFFWMLNSGVSHHDLCMAEMFKLPGPGRQTLIVLLLFKFIEVNPFTFPVGLICQ